MKDKTNITKIVLFIITLLYFTFGQGEVGYYLGGDSEAYFVTFKHSVEAMPIYPLFIHILDLVSWNIYYLNLAVVIQVILCTISLLYFVFFIVKQFSLKIWEMFIVWFLALLPYILLLPEDPIAHTIMAEALAYPLFYIFVVIILKGIFLKEQKYCYYGIIYGIMMALIRSQMQFLFGVVGIVFAYITFYNDKEKVTYKKIRNVFIKCVIMLGILLLSMKTVSVLQITYEKVFFNAPAQSYSSQTLIQRLLYVSDREDAELFEDANIREIFLNTYDSMEEEQTLVEYKPDTLLGWKHIVESCGANSRFVGAEIVANLEGRGVASSDEFGLESQVLEYSSQMVEVLMKAHLKEHLSVAMMLMPAGYVSSILFHKYQIYGLIHIAVLMAYLFAIITSMIIFWKNKGTENRKVAEYMLGIVVIAILNVTASNLILFGLQRYLAYTVGIFWVGMYLIVRVLWSKCFDNRKY